MTAPSHLVTAGSPVPVTARLAYDPSDPFAVSVSMRTDGGPTVEWVVSRDLLVAGLDAPAGDGDVGQRSEVVQGVTLGVQDRTELAVGDARFDGDGGMIGASIEAHDLVETLRGDQIAGCVGDGVE